MLQLKSTVLPTKKLLSEMSPKVSSVLWPSRCALGVTQHKTGGAGIATPGGDVHWGKNTNQLLLVNQLLTSVLVPSAARH